MGRNPVKEQPIFAASARHRLEPFDGALLLVRCIRPADLPRDEVVRSWRRLAVGPLSIRSLPGRHTQMFDTPHVTRFAVILREEIEAALPR